MSGPGAVVAAPALPNPGERIEMADRTCSVDGCENPELDHLCGVRRCCNPLHLEPVTRTENIRRAVKVREANRRAAA